MKLIFFLILLFPLTSTANKVSAIYNCDREVGVYLKATGDWETKNVQVFIAIKPEYEWKEIKQNNIKFFRDKLIIGKKLIMTSPSVGSLNLYDRTINITTGRVEFLPDFFKKDYQMLSGVKVCDVSIEPS